MLNGYESSVDIRRWGLLIISTGQCDVDYI